MLTCYQFLPQTSSLRNCTNSGRCTTCVYSGSNIRRCCIFYVGFGKDRFTVFHQLHLLIHHDHVYVFVLQSTWIAYEVARYCVAVHGDFDSSTHSLYRVPDSAVENAPLVQMVDLDQSRPIWIRGTDGQ